MSGIGTINSDDDDVATVAAVLGDAVHAGGLSDGHYRHGDDALGRLERKLKNLRSLCYRLSDQKPMIFSEVDKLVDEASSVI